MAGERVRVAEHALHRIAVVDAVGARHGVQRVDRLGAQLHRVGDVSLVAQLLLERGLAPGFGDRLRLGSRRPSAV